VGHSATVKGVAGCWLSYNLSGFQNLNVAGYNLAINSVFYNSGGRNGDGVRCGVERRGYWRDEFARNLLDYDSGHWLGQGARHASLDEVLVLVVVDVEVVEHGDFATTICTSGVVVPVNVDTKNIGVFHYLYFDNLLSHQLGSKCFLGGVDTTTQAILRQQHVGRERQGGEQGWLTRTTVIAACANELLDDLRWSCGVVDGYWMCVKSIIVCDRADLILIDLIIGDARTTIANQNSSCDFLVEH